MCIQAWSPPDAFYGAVQDLHKCLALVMEEDDCFIMEKRSGRGLWKTLWLPLPHQEPLHWKKPPQQKQSPIDGWSRGAYPLYFTRPSICTQTRRGFLTQVPEDLAMPPLEDAYMPGAITLFDLSTTLELLEMTTSHTPVTGKVHYCLQAWSLTRISKPSTSSWRHLEPSPRVKEPWTIITLCYIMGTPVLRIDLR